MAGGAIAAGIPVAEIPATGAHKRRVELLL